MKPNLRCKKCGNVKEFVTCSKNAKWDEKYKRWKPLFLSRNFYMCGKCNSIEIEEVEKDEQRS